MTAKRFLFALLWTGVVGTAGFGQNARPAGSGLFPPPPPPTPGTGPAQPPPAPAPGPDATAVLTAQPGMTAQPLPPGSVPGPWCGGNPAGSGCCGPFGANGPIVYELYARTGPSILAGEATMMSVLKNWGWNVAAGGRSLFMDKAGDAAWVFDLGLGYTYHGGDRETIINVNPTPRFVGAQTVIDQARGGTTATPTTNIETGIPVVVQRLMLTTFNYSVGRDWWLNGPGYVGAEQSWNSRIGLDVGGRWGTAHVELLPLTTDVNFLRRQGVTQSLFLGAHWNAEVPLGAWILFGGVRAEWGKTWTNLIPPQDGDLQEINLLLTAGIRF